jgi:hypothetical protein
VTLIYCCCVNTYPPHTSQTTEEPWLQGLLPPPTPAASTPRSRRSFTPSGPDGTAMRQVNLMVAHGTDMRQCPMGWLPPTGCSPVCLPPRSPAPPPEPPAYCPTTQARDTPHCARSWYASFTPMRCRVAPGPGRPARVGVGRQPCRARQPSRPGVPVQNRRARASLSHPIPCLAASLVGASAS